MWAAGDAAVARYLNELARLCRTAREALDASEVTLTRSPWGRATSWLHMQFDTGARFSDARPGQLADGGGANKASRGIV